MRIRTFALLYLLIAAPAYAITRGGPGQPMYHPYVPIATSTATATATPTPTITKTPTPTITVTP